MDTSLLASYALLTIPSQLVGNMGDKITFTNRILGTMIKQPLSQVQDFSDSTTEKKPGTEKMPSLFVHTYQKD